MGMSSAPAMVRWTTPRRPSLHFGRRRLADAGEGAGEVGVVGHRHQPVESHDGQRRVGPRRVAPFAVGPARGRQGVDHVLDPQRPGGQLLNAPGGDVAGLPGRCDRRR